jgi:UDP-2,3-diacylglucosamine pyrophosphatase LpxH
MTTILKGYFLSDLHLLARRSMASSVLPLIHDAASRSHTMILGGDIFDFKWSTMSSLDSSIDAAIVWLEELVVAHPRCSFYYLLGNHDSHPNFVAKLDKLAFGLPQLQWQPYVLRILDCVFLHGDIVDCAPNHTILQERRKLHESRPHPRRYAHMLYSLVVQARLHRAAMHIAIRPKGILRKLSRYLRNEGLDAEHGVRDVYFGHTHLVVDGVQYAGLTFHNGGASIRGLPFRIIETRLPVENFDEHFREHFGEESRKNEATD